MMPAKHAIIFLSHGGGPLPLLDDPRHQPLVSFLRSIPRSLINPKAIVVVSAHWEAPVASISGAAHPDLLYDYYGFPEASYSIQYPAAGAPELAQELKNHLQQAGLDANINLQRGLDHGVFVPLKRMYPEANIPCVQLSLVDSLTPATHIQLGKALAWLAQREILLVGSGFSFHNLPAFFGPTSSESQALNQAFEQWLMDTCCSTDYTEDQREQKLITWETAPGARFCHPREEHLLPLHVCYGAAHAAAQQSFSFEILGKLCSCYLW